MKKTMAETARPANRVNDINYRTGRLVMAILGRADLSKQKKNRYLRMVQRAGRNMLLAITNED